MLKMQCCGAPPPFLQAIQALLKQNPSLVYAHSKAGENLWHFAAQGGDAQVCSSSWTTFVDHLRMTHSSCAIM